jgi:hypothetical protein
MENEMLSWLFPWKSKIYAKLSIDASPHIMLRNIGSSYMQMEFISGVIAGRAVTSAAATANDSRQQIIGSLQVCA